jgi:hypothetical protein
MLVPRHSNILWGYCDHVTTLAAAKTGAGLLFCVPLCTMIHIGYNIWYLENCNIWQTFAPRDEIYHNFSALATKFTNINTSVMPDASITLRMLPIHVWPRTKLLTGIINTYFIDRNVPIYKIWFVMYNIKNLVFLEKTKGNKTRKIIYRIRYKVKQVKLFSSKKQSNYHCKIFWSIA